jgi:hypothetical protein
MALPLALCVVLALTIGVLSVIEFSASGTRGASLNKEEQDAFFVAEDGFNTAAAVLAANPTQPGPVSGSKSVRRGTVSWTGTWDAAAEVWRVSSTASVANPTGPGTSQVSHTVEGEFELGLDPGVWNFVYVKPAPGACLTFSNSFSMQAPLYVDGDLCLLNSARYEGPKLQVKGTVQTDNSASIGTAAAPIPTVAVKDNSPAASGCRYTSSPAFALPCTSAHKVWSTSFGTIVPDQTKPAINLAAEYAKVAPGSAARNHRCYASSENDLKALNGEIAKSWSTSRAGFGWPGAANLLDKDTTRKTNDAGIGVVDLMPQGASYDCRVYNADGTQLGRVAWSDGSPGTLTVDGLVFFDADIKIAKSEGVVNGMGMIYANNKIVFENNVSLCGVPDCGPSWNPNVDPPHLLFLFAGYTGNPSLELQNSAKLQGALYANGGMTIGNSAMVHGPVLANELQAQNNSDFNPWPWFTDVPDGLPGTAFVFRLKPGSWRG